MEYTLITYAQAEDQYRDYINEATPEIKILGMSYTPSRVLQEVDPIAYSTIFDEFTNHLYEDGTAVMDWNDERIMVCEECDVATDDYRGMFCKDCDKQAEDDNA